MAFRLKLLLATTLLAVVSAGIGVALVYRSAWQNEFARIQTEVRALAAATAAQMDGDAHARISVGEGEDYEAVVANLRRQRDAMRGAGRHVEFIYTFQPDASGNWIYVTDAEETPDLKSSYGDPLIYEAEEEEDLRLELGEPATADRSYTEDQYGRVLTGHAPIYDSEGQAVARVGVDLRAADVQERRRDLFSKATYGLLAALLAGGVLAYLIGRWASAPLTRVSGALEAIGDGKLDTRLKVGSGDEFGRVEEAVNTMAESLQQGRALRGALARYMSRDIAQDVVKLPREPEFAAGSETKRITVLFCDLDDFEKIDDAVPVERILEMLNAFFARAIAAVFDSGGTLDRFSGAGLMATFGADGTGEGQEGKALAAARAIVEAMRDAVRPLPEGVELQVRIGIHTGDSQVEHTREGSGGRMAFKAVGGAVDIAAIAMGHAAEVDRTIVITSATAKGLDGFKSEDVGEAETDGRPVRLLAVEEEG